MPQKILLRQRYDVKNVISGDLLFYVMVLNILYIGRKNKREKRESGSLCRDYIVLSLI
jgi:hypothetical protein